MKATKEATAAAIADPQPGDHFSEMLAYHHFVVARVENVVISIGASAPCSLPSDGKWYVHNLDQFKKFFQYKTNENFWVRLIERGCDVTDWLQGYSA